MDNEEIVYELAILPQRLGTNTSMGGNHIVSGEIRNQALQAPDKGRFAEGADHFLNTFVGMGRRQFPEGRICDDFGKITPVKVCFFVAFPLEAQHSVWPCMDAPINHAGKVYAEKGKRWIGHRINQSFDQMPRFGSEFVVFAPKGDIFRVGFNVAKFGDAIAVQTRTVNQKPRFKRSLVGFQNVSSGGIYNSIHSGSQPEFASTLPNQFSIGLADLLIVSDACGKYAYAREAANVRLNLAHRCGC